MAREAWTRKSTMKVSELIDWLSGIKDQYGDVPVFHSCDPEMNEFGTINPGSVFVLEPKGLDQGVIAIAPWMECIDTDEDGFPINPKDEQ